MASGKAHKDIVERLVQLDERINLDSLPEVQAMRRIVCSKPDFDQHFISKLCVAAALNNYQEMIRANLDEGSYWGRFVNWAVRDGQGVPPWRRFPNAKARRFARFRTSKFWDVTLLEMDSGRIRAGLAEAMRQDSLKKTICFAPLVVARWAYVLGRPFVVVSDHPVPVDSRISRLFEKMRGIDPHMAIQEANEVRRKFGRQELNMSDFDAWAWQSGE